MDFFQDNFTFFKDFDPSMLQDSELWGEEETYPVQFTRHGEGWVQIGNIAVHNRISPSKDAAKNLEKQGEREFNIHFGFGLGYFFEAQKNRKNVQDLNSCEILIFEPDIKLLRTALLNVSFRKLFQGTRSRIFCDKKKFLQTLELEYGHFTSYEILAIPYHASRFPQILNAIVEKLKSLALQKSFFQRSDRRMASVFAASTLRSFKYWSNAYAFDPLYLAFKDKPAVILSPGPSLEKNLCELIPYRENVVIFAVSRVAAILEAYGIQPDFLVHIEAQDFFRLIEGRTNLSNSVFLLQEQVEKKYYQYPCRCTITYHNACNQMASFLNNTFPSLKKMSIPTGGSVAQNAFSSAVFMGCNPVILMGQDLALSEGRMYSHRDEGIAQHLRSMQIKGFFGNQVTTIDNYEKFRLWFVDAAEAYQDHFKGIRFINATEGGACIEGFEPMSLRHAAYLFFNQKIPVNHIVNQALRNAQKSDLKTSVIQASFRAWKRGFNELTQACEGLGGGSPNLEDLKYLLQLPFESAILESFLGFDLKEELETLSLFGTDHQEKCSTLFEAIKKQSSLILSLLQETCEDFK